MKAKQVPSAKKKGFLSHRITGAILQLDPSTKYKEIEMIGSGAFGAVFKAISPDGEEVAIKKVTQDPKYKNRELSILQLLDHPNCLRLKNYFLTKEGSPESVYLHIVSDLYPLDLTRFLRTHKKPDKVLVKKITYQLFSGLQYIHANRIMHRDVKPSNVLLDLNTGKIQLCDFGSAKSIVPGETSISYIATRNFRAPELLFGSTTYGSSVDIWAAGCVVAQILLKGEYLFNGNSNVQLIKSVTELLGTPSEEDNIEMAAETPYKGPSKHGNSYTQVFGTDCDPLLLSLLQEIFVYSPIKRLSASQCLNHEYFREIRDGSIEMPEDTI